MKKPDMYLNTGILYSVIDYMTLEEKGALLDALVLFHEEGTIRQFDKPSLQRTYTKLTEQSKEKADNYIETCKKNQDNANKRWEKEKAKENNKNTVNSQAVNDLMGSVKTLWMRDASSEDEKTINNLLKKYPVPDIRGAMMKTASVKPNNYWGYVTGILQEGAKI